MLLLAAGVLGIVFGHRMTPPQGSTVLGPYPASESPAHVARPEVPDGPSTTPPVQTPRRDMRSPQRVADQVPPHRTTARTVAGTRTGSAPSVSQPPSSAAAVPAPPDTSSATPRRTRTHWTWPPPPPPPATTPPLETTTTPTEITIITTQTVTEVAP